MLAGMGLARDLTMGPKRRRQRPDSTGDFALIRRLTAEAEPDLDQFRAALDRVGAQRSRFRFAEGDIYTAGCTKYSELTGRPYGIQQGTY